MFPLDKKETRVQALGGENPLEKDMATHSSILAWWIPRTEEPGKLVHRVTETRLKQLSMRTQPLWIPSLCFLASLEAPRPFNPVTVPGISQYSSWAPQSLSCCLCNPGPSSEPQNLEAGKKKKKLQKNEQGWTSLMTQWVRICLPMQGTWVWSLIWEDPTCCRTTKPISHNHWACAYDPVSRNYWSPCAYSLCSGVREATAVISPRTATRESPPRPTKTQHSQK